jgi:hypothetical protein
MTREVQSRLGVLRIELPALSNHRPCMAHVIQLALGALMSSLDLNGRTMSLEAEEPNQDLERMKA